MKTFYDLLDTKDNISYCCKLTVLYKTIAPNIAVEINNKIVYDGLLEGTKIINGTFDAVTHLSVMIRLQGKQYNRDSESSVRLDSFLVDDFEIKEAMTNSSVYAHDSPESQHTVTNHIGWNGTWKFDAGMPFYHFKHKVKNRGWLIVPQ